MLNGLRKAGQSVVGKIIATILFVILIFSFAIWGIGDIFRTTPQNVVARVGRTDISTEQYRTAFNNELARLNRQFGGRLTVDQARALGLDRQVLARLVNEALLNEKTRQLGLSVSDQLVARSIMDGPTFRDGSGQFNRALFDATLRENGLSEAAFIRDQRLAAARLHLAEGLAGGLPVPLAAQEAQHRLATERRAASYIVLPASVAGTIPEPSEEEVREFYDSHKAAYRAPEYRALSVLSLDPQTLARPDAVPDAEAKSRYEERKASLGTPERRTLQQIGFSTKEEAEAALARIKAGASFEDIATEKKLSPQELTLGTFARSEILDRIVADAAFGLPVQSVSEVIDGRFGPVLVRVSAIEPQKIPAFEEVAPQIKSDIAKEKARASLDDLHDAIEDMRASARSLSEIATEKNLQIVSLAAIDRNGRDKNGQAVPNLPEAAALLQAAYASDIGVDNEPLRTKADGYVWFDVTGIDSTRDKPLEEVRAEVVAQWRADAVERKLAEKGRALVEQIDKGEPMDKVATETGIPTKIVSDLARNTAKDEFSAEVVNRIFATPVGKAGSVAMDEERRLVFVVTSATVPPFMTTTQAAQRAQDQWRDGFGDTLLAEFIANAQTGISVVINEEAVRQIAGGGDS